MSQLEEFRARTRATWAAGDWDAMADLIVPVGPVALTAADVAEGMDVLDVGTGSGGNIAIPAALMGAHVVGSDLTPEMIPLAKARAAEAGVDVTWVEADAMELPFADDSFDRVISTFGAMFAPDHKRTAAELARVCRPGGRIVMTTWQTDGFAGAMFKTMSSFMPPPPPGIEGPLEWGDPAHVAEVFGSIGLEPVLTPNGVSIAFASVDQTLEFHESNLGPLVVARAALEPAGRWEDVRAAFRSLIEQFDRNPGDSVQILNEYYVITVDC